MKFLAGYTSIKVLYEFLGREVASAFSPFHALTGCAVTGKLSRKSKAKQNNDNFIQALLSLHSCRFEEVMPEISKVICRLC